MDDGGGGDDGDGDSVFVMSVWILTGFFYGLFIQG
jgi:hypothetical protein